MSKANNVNPGQYDDGNRNHQGEGILHEHHKDVLSHSEKSNSGTQGQPNFIPGEAPVGEQGKSSRKDDEGQE